MKNIESLKKRIIFRSTHRGTKEMDLLLGEFAKKYINVFSYDELKLLDDLMAVDDETLYDWYFKKIKNKLVSANKISIKLKNFKI
tara:strand:- start:51 stop:305 length:255 start_codon:yes stop_codon:yes gene_type:complete